MMTTRNIRKKIFAGGVVMLGVIAPVLAIKVSLDPLYMDARFEPASTLHAGCINSTNVMFQSEGQKIENVHLVFSYIPDDIQIVRVTSTADKSLINYNIDHDSLVLNYLNQKSKKLSNVTLFQIYFKSSDNLTSTVLSLDKWSYALLKGGDKVALNSKSQLTFAKGMECDPDEVPPVVSLVSPQNNEEPIPLDRYFVFDIKDTGKWVDKQSIQIDFAGEQYDATSKYLQRNSDYLVFYPKTWLPVDVSLVLTITASDLQKYGWANEIKKSFSFETAKWMVLLNNINPEIYRKIVGKAVNVFASAPECRMLKQLYAEIDTTSQTILGGVFGKLACDVSDLSTFVQQEAADKVHAADMTSFQANKKVSVLGVLWWVLFSVALMLKLYYYVAYRKHKKIAEQISLQLTTNN